MLDNYSKRKNAKNKKRTEGTGRRKRGQKAQAGVIATILLILIVLAAIIVVWNVVNRVVKKGAEGIGTEALTVNLEISEAKLFVTGGAEVKVHRGSGKGEITELKFVFEKSDGESEIIARKAPDYEMPDELETKIYYFNASEINEKIEKVSIAPMFGSSTGVQVSEPETEIKKDNSGERILDASDGLVSWWMFDGDFTDAVNSNHGTALDGNLTNGDGDTPPKIINNVVVFDGIDDYVKVADSPNWKSESLTASLWLFPKGWVDSNTGWASHHLYPYGGDGFGIITNSINWGWWIRTAAGRQYGGGTPHNNQLNTWHNLVLTYDKTSGDMKFYLNGVLNKSSNLGAGTSINWGAGVLRVGHGNSYATNGSIDDVMIFNRSLSSEEITAIYNN